LAGYALPSQYNWTFTTAGAPDTTKPTVIAENPVAGAIGVPTNQAVTATFSKAMNANTITITSPATFTLTAAGTPPVTVAGLVTYASVGNTATFTPNPALSASTVYTATITSAATDLSGNAVTAIGGLPLSWSFTTGTAPVTTAPTIVSTSPVNGAINVLVNSTVNATFDKAMAPLTINSATFTLTGPGGTVITGTYAYSAATLTATFTPSANLLAATIYTADITNGATDSTGNPLGSGIAPNPWSFTTSGVALPPSVVLGSAAAFGGFGGNAGMTNQGLSTVINNGSIGTTAVSSYMTGFHDNSIGPPSGSGPTALWPCTYTEAGSPGPNFGPVLSGTGNIGIFTAPGTTQPTTACPDEGTAYTFGIAQAAALYANAAYISISPAAMPGGLDVSNPASCPAPQCIVTGGSPGPGELGGRTLQAGVYMSTPGFYKITSLPLVLDAQNNPNATWVFQMGSSLTVGGPTAAQNVTVINGSVANCANVFWQVSSQAVIDYYIGVGTPAATFCGTVIAYSGATTGDAGVYNESTITINGRLLSLVASVTLVNTVINVPAH
jgi:hypothetical protein